MNPERIPVQKFAPESIISYVAEHKKLPKISTEELQRLNDEMTQEQVLQYYIAADDIEDGERRKEVLDRWIPKPKILYHASKAENVDEFAPRERHKRRPDDPPQVFGAISEAVAAIMLAPGDDRHSKSGSYDGHRSWTFIYPDTEEFRKQDTGGYVYQLPPDDFTVDPDIGLGLAEWTSIKPVKPLGKPKRYSLSIEAMLQHRVKVYPVDQETFRKFRNEDYYDSELLKNLRPLEQPPH